jgi:Xaa-Pro aminopeptidase
MFTDDRRGMFLAALDGIAWVTNCRGYHLPHLSSFRAKALVTRRKVYVFVTPETPVSAQARQSEGLEWVFVNAAGTAAELERLQNALHLDRVELDPSQLSAADYGMLLRVFGPDRLEEKRGGVVEWMSIKEPAEISAMEEGFRRGDRAIHATLKWAKDAVTAGKSPSERELWEQTTIQYRAQGAVEQSFNTIAGVGPNGSIIHYGNPSADVKIKPCDMVLLDSGGYFDGGFATDTTRTFFASHTGKPDPEHRKIYTLVLKGLLACQYAVFADGTKGIVLDGLARAPLMKHGFNFNHGTGHGVGVHVHEDGVRLSPLSNLPMRAGQVVSIEPGIYVPGFAGVRLENVALVEPHPQFKGFLRFRSLVWVGFDPALVDVALLNDEEKAQWADYEKGCAARGTSFMSAV